MLGADKSAVAWLQLKRFVRRQQSFIAIAVAIYVGLWAANVPGSLGAVLFYTLPLCNLIVLVQEHLGFLYNRERGIRSWCVYGGLILVVAVVGVTVVNVIRYSTEGLPGQTLRQFMESGWKFPFTATMIVGISSELYRRMRERLEKKNRELQQAIEIEAALRESQELELQQAREIQQSLLPKEIPQIEGFEIDGMWEPARVVGGDYFDVIPLGGSRMGICIADVVGKSVSAALLMANVQASVRAFAADSESPASLCSRVNSVLCSHIGTGKFVTLFYGVLDGKRESFTYTNAGHLLPVVICMDGSTKQLKKSGAVLGVFPSWPYEDSSIKLKLGDRLLLFTDGITEAESTSGEEFGEERLVASAQAGVEKTAVELKEHLMSDVKQFCGEQFRDDATLIVIAANGNRSGEGELLSVGSVSGDAPK